MTADHGLLGVALAPVRQPIALAAGADAFDHALDDALGEDGGTLNLRLVGSHGRQDLVLLILVVGEDLGVERLR